MQHTACSTTTATLVAKATRCMRSATAANALAALDALLRVACLMGLATLTSPRPCHCAIVRLLGPSSKMTFGVLLAE